MIDSAYPPPPPAQDDRQHVDDQERELDELVRKLQTAPLPEALSLRRAHRPERQTLLSHVARRCQQLVERIEASSHSSVQLRRQAEHGRALMALCDVLHDLAYDTWQDAVEILDAQTGGAQ